MPSIRSSSSNSSISSTPASPRGVRRVVAAIKRPFRKPRFGKDSKSATLQRASPAASVDPDHHSPSLEPVDVRQQSPPPVIYIGREASLSSGDSETMADTVDEAKISVHSDAGSAATHELSEPTPADSAQDAAADTAGDVAPSLYPTPQGVIDTSLPCMPLGADAPPPSEVTMPELTHAPGSTLSLGNIAEVEEPSAEQEQEQEQSNDLQTVVASSASAQALPTAGIVEDTSNTIPDPAITEDVAAAEDAIDDLTVPPDPALSEPELPDPFVVDESAGQSLSASVSEVVEPSPAPSSINLEQSVPAVDEIALAQSTILSPSASSSSQPLPSPNLNKAVPSPPAAESDDEDAPDLYLPSLLLPTMFLPIPNTDPLTSLLMKYVPPERRPARDLTGEWQRSEFPTLVMTNSWRALARMARDRLLEADPEDLTLVLSLWYLRLASLARLRLFNQTSAECTNLFSVLNGIEPPSAREWVFERALPFELEVLHARLKYWAGDHMGHLDALAALLRKCRTRARARPADAEMWRERGARVALILASHLIEMKDFAAAARLLGPLCEQAGGVTSPAVRSSVGRVYLQSGCIAAAAQHFHAVAQDPTADPALKGMNAALLATAEGDWSHAASELQRLLQADPEHFVAVNNLAVAYLNQGKLQEGIRLLEEAIRAAPSTVLAAEPLLFNISTMYELRSTAGMDKKRDLLIEVAKWAGDGLRTTCLKMPTN